MFKKKKKQIWATTKKKLYERHWPKSHCYNYKCNIVMHHHQNSQPGDKFVELDKKYLFRQRGHYYMAEVYLYLLHSVIEQIKETLYSLSPQAAVNRPSLESIWQGSWSWHRVSSVRELVWHATTHTTLFWTESRESPKMQHALALGCLRGLCSLRLM